MENRFGKRCLFSLLFFVAVLTMGISASAADAHSGWKQVNTLNDLSNETDYSNAHVVKPGCYYLEKNIVIPEYFSVNNGDVTICLHGHSITSTGDIFTFMVRNGASLRIETCGDGDGELINSYNYGVAAVYLEGGSKFEVTDGAVSCRYGDAIRIIDGTVKLYNSNIETGSSGESGVYIEHGSLNITGGRVKCYEYGINISQYGPVNITIQGALVTGFWGGICSSSVNSSYPIVVNVQEDSDIQASNGDLPCIFIEPGNSQIKIADGKFVGVFKPGMNLKAAGGLYTSNSIKGYVADGYICRTRSDNYYTYGIEAKRTYTVIFTDGNGHTLKTAYVLEGDSAKAPPAPTRPGFIFAGWDKGFGNLSGSETTITVNATWKTGEINQSPKTVVDLKKVKGLKLSRGKGRIRVRWKKASKKAKKTFSKYEIQYGRKKDFSDAKKITVKKNLSRALLKKLKRHTKYYVRIRVKKVVGNVTHVSKWTTKTIKTR